MTRRTRRSVAGSVLVVLGLVIGAVIATALQAEGRERSKADTNDGGAWLLKRDAGYVGHVNREVGEITAAVSVSDPGSDFDVDQAKGVIVVHDATKGTVTVVDDSVERVANPAGVRGRLGRAGPRRRRRRPDRRRRLDEGVEARPASSCCRSPRPTTSIRSSRASGRTLSAATTDGHAVLVDEKAGQVVFLRPDGTTTNERHRRGHRPDGGGDDARHRRGRVLRHRRRRRRRLPRHARPLDIDVLGADGQPSALALQQPGPAADDVVAVTTDGKVVAVPLDGGDAGRRHRPARRRRPGGPDRLRRVRVRGVDEAGDVHPVVRRRHVPDGAPRWKEIQAVPLDGAGAELRLRLVNGWVWINDIDTGAAWVTSPQQRVDRVEDWGNILSQLNDDSQDDDTDQEGGEVVTEVNPDDPNAEIVQSDQIDQNGPNKPPIARDDQGETRVDRPIDVDVLANDTDPNGDVLVVTAVAAGGWRRPARHRPRRTQRAGVAGGRVHRHRHVRLHDHRRPRRQRRGQRRRRGAPVRRQRQPSARRPQRHRLDPPRPADDVRRARQRHRPRRRRPRARLDRPQGPGQRRRSDRPRPIGPGRVHPRPEHDARSGSS